MSSRLISTRPFRGCPLLGRSFSLLLPLLFSARESFFFFFVMYFSTWGARVLPIQLLLIFFFQFFFSLLACPSHRSYCYIYRYRASSLYFFADAYSFLLSYIYVPAFLPARHQRLEPVISCGCGPRSIGAMHLD